jgi:hypothetical protein
VSKQPVFPRRRPEIHAQELGEELLLLGADGNAVHVLNPTARWIWERCDGRHTAAEIAEALRASFAVAPERDVAADVERTLSVFAAKGLLV